MNTLAMGSYCTYFLLYIGFVFVCIPHSPVEDGSSLRMFSSLGTLLATYCDYFQLLDVLGRHFVTHVK